MERFVIVDGGMREQFQADMWIVADGEKPPAASPDTTLQIREENGLFDEYVWNSDSDLAEYFDSSVRLTGFAKALSNEPNARGYIVGYAQCLDITETTRVSKGGKDEYVSRQYKQCDPAGTGARIGRIEKRSLLKLSGLPQSGTAVIDGGYRNAQMVELWVMPGSAESPKPTPTAHPWQRK